MDTPGSVCFVDEAGYAWQTMTVRSTEPRNLLELNGHTHLMHLRENE
jgi:hypothetical protein